jgi:uncharacterized protein (DUF1778 family)
VVALKSRQLQIRVTPAQKRALQRLARAAGLDVSSYVLARALPSGRARLDAVVRALGAGEDPRFALAALSDLLAGWTPAEFSEHAAHLDARALSPFLQNYVAAMVEHAAARLGEPAPAWTRDVPPLDDPWFAAPLDRLRPYLVRVSPVAFRRRNLFVDATVGDRV